MKLPVPQLRRARIEIVPMIDTIFFLLVFFMITWLSMVRMSGLGMSLPRQNTTTHKPPAPVVVAVSRSGVYYVDSTEIAQSAWRARLAQAIAAHPTSPVIVEVDPAQRTQELVSLIDAVNTVEQSTGAKNPVLIATQRVTTSPALPTLARGAP